MPRTRPVRKSKQVGDSEECDVLIEDFKKQTDLRIMKLESEARMSIKSLTTFIDLEVSRIPSEIRQMTIGDILQLENDGDDQKENYDEVSSSVNDELLSTARTTRTRGAKRVTAVSDDGYVTESTGTVKRQSRARKVSTNMSSTMRTRSSSRNSKAKLSEVGHKPSMRGRNKPNTNESSADTNKFKTPAPLKPNNIDFAVVTPKVKPNTPMSVLRRPRQGETVISMQGSPLLVSAVVKEETANINVPLGNGNVISLLPNEGLRMSHVPALDPETKRQLETLKSHIEKVISLN